MVTFLTQAGTDLMNELIGDEGQLVFTKIQFGNGQNWPTVDEEALREAIRVATELQNSFEEVEFDPQEGSETNVIIDPETGLALIKASFNNFSYQYGQHVTEIGIWAQNGEDSETEVLYAVSAEDLSKAAWIPANDEGAATFKFSVYVYIGDVANVTAVLSLNSDKASAQDLADHIQDKNNPHETNAAQVGLGNVPNVTTNNQRPFFTMASEFANIDGGTQINPETGEEEGKETLSEIFGKVKMAISVLDTHRNRTDNPHKVTAAQVNAAPVKHYHSADDINEGVLRVERGGTGLAVGAIGTGNGYNCHGHYEAPGGLLIQWGRVLRDNGGSVLNPNREVDVYFDVPYKDTNYVLTYTSGYGTIGGSAARVTPEWYVPTKYTNRFTMKSDSVRTNQVADWIAIGFK